MSGGRLREQMPSFSLSIPSAYRAIRGAYS